MSLYETFYQNLIIMDRKTISDGMGGFSTEWVEGATFKGAVVTQATTEQRVAEKQLGEATYQITTPVNVVLDYGMVIKCAKLDKYLKITSDNKDVETPQVATFGFRQCTATEWELPK